MGKRRIKVSDDTDIIACDKGVTVLHYDERGLCDEFFTVDGLVHIGDVVADGQVIPCYGPADEEELRSLAITANLPRTKALLRCEAPAGGTGACEARQAGDVADLQLSV